MAARCADSTRSASTCWAPTTASAAWATASTARHADVRQISICCPFVSPSDRSSQSVCVCARDSEIVILFIYFFFRVWELQLNVGGPRVFALYVYIIRCCVAVKLTHFMYVECRRTDYSSTCYD